MKIDDQLTYVEGAPQHGARDCRQHRDADVDAHGLALPARRVDDRTGRRLHEHGPDRLEDAEPMRASPVEESPHPSEARANTETPTRNARPFPMRSPMAADRDEERA